MEARLMQVVSPAISMPDPAKSSSGIAVQMLAF